MPKALSKASRTRLLASETRCPYSSTMVVIDLWPSYRETSEQYEERIAAWHRAGERKNVAGGSRQNGGAGFAAA